MLLFLLATPLTFAQETGEENNTSRHGHGPGKPRLRPKPETRQNAEYQKQPRPENAPEEVDFPTEFRSIDGSSNNLTNTEWGSADQPYLRRFLAHYTDGTDSPAGADRPNARSISNVMAVQTGSVENRRGATDFLWQWGQFLDHDISETPAIDPVEEFNIEVTAGDPWFDPQGAGEAMIPLNRSLYVHVDDLRQQINAITSYIDASNIYGSDAVRAFALRRLDGSGKLKTTVKEHGDLLPYNSEGLDNSPTSSSDFFLAGDVRANEQTGLLALHTLFVREHNYQAEQYQKVNPNATDEETYQYARMMVIGEIQAITYREFLPVLLDRKALRPYDGYNPDVNAGISNVFACAAYRFGHSLIPSTLLRLDENGDESDGGHLPLTSAFFNPSLISDEGIDTVLRGMAGQRCQELDAQVVDELRNFLFGEPAAGGLDLAALNIQRGRDHGIPSYNEARIALGMKPAEEFEDISPDEFVAHRLAEAYNNVDEVDLWVGALCEPHVRGAMVGPVSHRLLTEQFMRLRDGDRFWYQHYLPKEMQKVIEEQTLATIIRRNTDIGDELPDHVFRLEETTPNAPPHRHGGRR